MWTINFNIGVQNRTFYDCFNSPFTADFGSPSFHLPPITIDDIPRPHKRALDNPDLIPAAISVASEDYVSTLNTPSDFPDILPSYDTNTLHLLKEDLPFQGRVNRGYCCRKNRPKRCYKRKRFYCSTCSDNSKKFYFRHGFFRISSETMIFFLEHQHYMSQFFS